MFSTALLTARANPVSHIDPLSRDLRAVIDESIVQPPRPVVVFCWLVSPHGSNKMYRCKLCDTQFTGSAILAMMHFGASSQDDEKTKEKIYMQLNISLLPSIFVSK